MYRFKSNYFDEGEGYNDTVQLILLKDNQEIWETWFEFVEQWESNWLKDIVAELKRIKR